MILKEAYRYQNFLSDLIENAEFYMTSKNFITVTDEYHNRSKVNPDGVDETVRNANVDVSFTPMQIIDFIVKALAEKKKLSEAIAEAKKNTEIDIDAAVAMNKCYQRFVANLNFMNGFKASENESQGKDYKFTVDDEQKPYYYPIRSVTEINFDRNDVKKLIKKYSKLADEVSTKLDQIQLTTEVDYENSYGWDYSDKLEDVVV